MWCFGQMYNAVYELVRNCSVCRQDIFRPWDQIEEYLIICQGGLTQQVTTIFVRDIWGGKRTYIHSFIHSMKMYWVFVICRNCFQCKNKHTNKETVQGKGSFPLESYMLMGRKQTNTVNKQEGRKTEEIIEPPTSWHHG